MSKKSKKRKQAVPYDLGNLRSMAKCIERMRRPLKEGRLPSIKAVPKGVEKALRLFPDKERETVEKFFGLTGGPNYNNRIIGAKDIAILILKKKTELIMENMLRIDYLAMFDKNFQNLIEKILQKVDRSGTKVEDVDVIKYLVVFKVFIDKGPKMPFEEADNETDMSYDTNTTFDEYAVVQCIWEENCCNVPDGSIKLRLLIKTIEMLDIKDIVAIKKYANLPIEKDERIEEIEKLQFFAQIRKFKERVFPYGAWNIISILIMGNVGEEVKLDGFLEHLDLLRQDMKNILQFENGTKTISTSQGLQTLKVYSIGGLEFTDSYEIMTLYLLRNMLTE